MSAQQWETLLEKARKLKEAGNEAFKLQDYKQAKKCYHHCLLNAKAVLHIPTHHGIPRGLAADGTQEDEPASPTLPFHFPLPSGPEPGVESHDLDAPAPVPPPVPLHPHAREGKDLITACYNNLAACIVQNADIAKKDDLSRAVDYCDKVLEDVPTNTKALYRKGVALFYLKEYDRALEVFQRAESIESSSDNHKMIGKCRRELTKYEQASRRELRGMLDRGRPLPHGGGVGGPEAVAEPGQFQQHGRGGPPPLPIPTSAQNGLPHHPLPPQQIFHNGVSQHHQPLQQQQQHHQPLNPSQDRFQNGPAAPGRSSGGD